MHLADHPRQRETEHYVNLPRDADGLAEPCPLAPQCVVSAIEQDLAVLSSSSATEQEQLESLTAFHPQARAEYLAGVCPDTSTLADEAVADRRKAGPRWSA